MWHGSNAFIFFKQKEKEIRNSKSYFKFAFIQIKVHQMLFDILEVLFNS